MEFYDCFATSYASARQRFLELVRQKGGRLRHYTHPDKTGPAGEELAVDVATFGSSDASRALLIISGTHGLEGFLGSAAQIAWLHHRAPFTLPDDVAIVMVHAINPWGFAHLSRTTENNVDLNRNFIDFAAGLPSNPGYADLHGRLLGPEWTQAQIEAAQRVMDEYADKHGADALFNTLARGQYSHPDGLNYGGTAPEWSHRVLKTLLEEQLPRARQVAFIDWHTGVGEYGQPFFLCFNEDGSDLQARAAAWWGEDRIRGQRPHGRARPDYQGLLFHGVQAFMPQAEICGAVVEFGTRGWHMRRMLRLDLWLKFHAAPEHPGYAMLQADLLDSFCPVDQFWRDGALKHACEITDQAMQGLIGWERE